MVIILKNIYPWLQESSPPGMDPLGGSCPPRCLHKCEYNILRSKRSSKNAILCLSSVLSSVSSFLFLHLSGPLKLTRTSWSLLSVENMPNVWLELPHTYLFFEISIFLLIYPYFPMNQENWSVKYIENVTEADGTMMTRKPREMVIFECTEDS